MCVCVCVCVCPTLLDAGEAEQLDQAKVVAGDDGLPLEGSVCCIDVVDLGVLGPDAVDL